MAKKSKKPAKRSQYATYRDRLAANDVVNRPASAKARSRRAYLAARGEHKARVQSVGAAIKQKGITTRSGKPPTPKTVRTWTNDWRQQEKAGIPKRALLAAANGVGIARVFKSGNSQAVRLPKAFRVKGPEVEIFRRGEEIVIRELKRKKKYKGLEEVLDLIREIPLEVFEGIKDTRPPEKRKGL